LIADVEKLHQASEIFARNAAMVEQVITATVQPRSVPAPIAAAAAEKPKPIAAGNANSKGGSLPPTVTAATASVFDNRRVGGGFERHQIPEVEIFGRNEGPNKLLSGTGPITREMWSDPKQVLGKLTQWSKNDEANMHCVGCDMLAGAIIHGPEVAARYLEKIASFGNDFLADEHVEMLKAIAGRIRSGTATFEDLASAQDITFRAIDREMVDNQDSIQIDNGSGKHLTASELANISREKSEQLKVAVTAAVRQFGSHHIVTLNYKTEYVGAGDYLESYEVSKAASAIRLNLVELAYDRSRTDSAQVVMDQLRKGECATVIIYHAVSDGSTEGHCILFGKYPDGSPYIYNSHPINGQATFIVGKPGKSNNEFKAELARYNEGMQQTIREHVWFPAKISYNNL
jgi:hypothetical protein